MDDISDGIASEANEIASASAVGLILYADRLPLSEELVRFAATAGRDPVDYALYGGEDYELLFTMPADAAEEFIRSETGSCCTVIGEVGSGRSVVLVSKDGSTTKLLEPRGYNHFR
jgi:thiamine-monophosphate kinase